MPFQNMAYPNYQYSPDMRRAHEAVVLDGGCLGCGMSEVGSIEKPEIDQGRLIALKQPTGGQKRVAYGRFTQLD